jgi:hypothetical protein
VQRFTWRCTYSQTFLQLMFTHSGSLDDPTVLLFFSLLILSSTPWPSSKTPVIIRRLHTQNTHHTHKHKSVTFSLMSFSRPRNTFFLLSYHQREIITKLLVTIDETKKSILNVVRMNGAVLCRESVWMLLRWERPGRHPFVGKCQRHAQPGIFTLIAFVKVQTDAKSL